VHRDAESMATSDWLGVVVVVVVVGGWLCVSEISDLAGGGDGGCGDGR
jgi:hypothetical protein